MTQPMRVLALTLYPQAFSSLIRVENLLPELRAHQVTVTVRPAVSSKVFETCYLGSRSQRWEYHFSEGLRRISHCVASERYDLVWVQKGLTSIGWRGLPALLDMFNGRLVYDWDDDVLNHTILPRPATGKTDHSQGSALPAWTWPLVSSGEVRSLLRSAELVCCGNPNLVDIARQHAAADRCQLLPSCVPVAAYAKRGTPAETPTVVWMGTQSNHSYLLGLRDVFADLGTKHKNLQLLVVSDSPLPIEGEHWGSCKVSWLKWSRETETQQLKRGWVGIMPLGTDGWSSGKSGYKLLVYQACGLPVVATPTGVNRELVKPGCNGFLAESHNEWVAALDRILTDRTEAQALGASGRCQVTEEYSTVVWGKRLAEWMQALGPRPRV